MSMPAFLRSADTPSISPLFAPTADMFGDMGVSMSFACGEEIYAQGEETDLVYQVQMVAHDSFRPLETYTAVAVGYFAILFPLTLYVRHRERVSGAKR